MAGQIRERLAGFGGFGVRIKEHRQIRDVRRLEAYQRAQNYCEVSGLEQIIKDTFPWMDTNSNITRLGSLKTGMVSFMVFPKDPNHYIWADVDPEGTIYFSGSVFKKSARARITEEEWRNDRKLLPDELKRVSENPVFTFGY